MVIRSLILALLSHAAMASTPADLSAGREALARGDAPAALAAYKGIVPGDKLWTDKLEDLARFHLLQDAGAQEAWRVLQVGRRTHADRAGWDDYERLAIFKAGGCPLALPVDDELRGHLLTAAVYRLSPFIFAREGAPSEDGQTHLAAGLTPYLQDIPQTEIARGQGCRAAKVLARKPEAVQRSELSELKAYLDMVTSTTTEAVLVRLRALELATKLKKDTKALAARLPALDLIPWLKFEDPERQWLFVHSFNGARTFADIPEAKRAQAQQLALQALNAPEASPFWLAEIDVDRMPLKERQKVYTRVLELGPFEGRSWVLMQLALTDAELGETSAALNVVRRLLVEGEEKLTPNQEEAALHLAINLFTEHRLDERTEGALAASLPPAMWNTLVQESLLHAAAEGRTSDFTKLTQMQERVHHRYGGPTLEMKLTQAMARRDLGAFRKALPGRGYGQEARLISFAQTLARLDYEEKPSTLQTFENELASRLESITYAGSIGAQEMADLIQVLKAHPNERQKGEKSVRQGVVKVGVARWHFPDLKPQDFALQPPASLPRRDLYYLPDAAGTRGWVFSTAKR